MDTDTELSVHSLVVVLDETLADGLTEKVT